MTTLSPQQQAFALAESRNWIGHLNESIYTKHGYGITLPFSAYESVHPLTVSVELVDGAYTQQSIERVEAVLKGLFAAIGHFNPASATGLLNAMRAGGTGYEYTSVNNLVKLDEARVTFSLSASAAGALRDWRSGMTGQAHQLEDRINTRHRLLQLVSAISAGRTVAGGVEELDDAAEQAMSQLLDMTDPLTDE